VLARQAIFWAGRVDFDRSKTSDSKRPWRRRHFAVNGCFEAFCPQRCVLKPSFCTISAVAALLISMSQPAQFRRAETALSRAGDRLTRQSVSDMGENLFATISGAIRSAHGTSKLRRRCERVVRNIDWLRYVVGGLPESRISRCCSITAWDTRALSSRFGSESLNRLQSGAGGAWEAKDRRDAIHRFKPISPSAVGRIVLRGPHPAAADGQIVRHYICEWARSDSRFALRRDAGCCQHWSRFIDLPGHAGLFDDAGGQGRSKESPSGRKVGASPRVDELVSH